MELALVSVPGKRGGHEGISRRRALCIGGLISHQTALRALFAIFSRERRSTGIDPTVVLATRPVGTWVADTIHNPELAS